MDNYYKSRGRRIFDFFLGALGIWAFNLLINYIFGFINLGLSKNNLHYYSTLSTLFPILILIVNIGTFVYFFRVKRTYIALGMITSVIVVPLLLFGSCLLLFTGSSLFGR